MKTASFQTYDGPGRISIARYAPRSTPAGYRQFKALAPGPWFNSVSRGEYEALFAKEILAPLDPQKTFDTLQALAGGPDVEPVLLCWEKPPFDDDKNWCHRRMVAEWFHRHLGITVDELPHDVKLSPRTVAKRAAAAAQTSLIVPGTAEGAGEIAKAARRQR